jgi:hypothetical protein
VTDPQTGSGTGETAARHSRPCRKIKKLEAIVADLGVPEDQIYHESYG